MGWRGWFGQGARQNITEKDRIVELRTRMIATGVLIGGIQALILSCIIVIGLLDYSFVEFIWEHIRATIACLILPVFVGLPILGYIIIRDLFDPNFEPVNRPIKRISPIWPWTGLDVKKWIDLFRRK